MIPNDNPTVDQEAYQAQLLKLIAQGHNTRSAKRKMAREQR